MICIRPALPGDVPRPGMTLIRKEIRHCKEQPSTKSLYISNSYQEKLFSIDTEIFTPSTSEENLFPIIKNDLLQLI